MKESQLSSKPTVSICVEMESKSQTVKQSVTSSSPSPSIPDWDIPFTDEELEAIDAVFLSASSRSIRRKLPDSVLKPAVERNRFSLTPHRTPPEKMRLPVVNFAGSIKYSRTVAEVESSAMELIKFVEAKNREIGQAILGLDIEWKPSFRRGVPPGKAAVMQICGDGGLCYVMHIVHSGIPPFLRSLLEDPSSIKVGVGIGNDSVKVFKDHNVSTHDLLDLSRLAKQKFGGDMQKWGLRSLTEKLICKQVEKSNNIRLGNWEAERLSKAQLQYAATDAYLSWYLYEVLSTFPDAECGRAGCAAGVICDLSNYL